MIAGLLYDLTGQFSYGFYMSGASIFASGVICLPLRKISVSERRRAGLLTPSTDYSTDEVKKAMLPTTHGVGSSEESPF